MDFKMFNKVSYLQPPKKFFSSLPTHPSLLSTKISPLWGYNPTTNTTPSLLYPPIIIPRLQVNAPSPFLFLSRNAHPSIRPSVRLSVRPSRSLKGKRKEEKERG